MEISKDAAAFVLTRISRSQWGDCEDYCLWNITPCILVDISWRFRGTSLSW